MEKKLFWKTMKPLLTDKTIEDERIAVVENIRVVSDEKESI